jgi:SulP family sulfate permease
VRLRPPGVGDLIAGISVALVAIPQSLAYAELAGMPPEFGLFASGLPSLLAAMFVSSKYLQTGPVALTALLTFGALSAIAVEQTAEYIALAALLAFMVGVFRVALGLLRLGRVAYLLSDPVLLGFTTAAAILITSSQLPKALGVEGLDGGVIENAFDAATTPSAWSAAAIAFSVMALVAMFGGRRIHPLFPGVLVAVIAGIAISRATGYDGAVVSELDAGFITLSLDLPWEEVGTLIVPAIAIALVGFAEPASIARTFAAEEDLEWDADREMVSQGVANLAAGVSGAFPVGGSFSRSSLNRLAGATSAWAGAITGICVLIALPATSALEGLPQAVLGAIVIGAVVQLIKLRQIVELGRTNRVDGAVAVFTLVATIASAPRVERGVLAGIAVSLVVAGWRRWITPPTDGDRASADQTASR